MDMIPRNPADGIYPATDDYIHAMEVRAPTRFLFVSGTMGLDGAGRAPKELEKQLSLIWSNSVATRKQDQTSVPLQDRVIDLY